MSASRGVRQALSAFGMDTITLAGPLEGKLQAMQEAGFSQLTLQASELVAHAGGWRAAVAAVRASGMRVTAFQLLRDFEGLSGQLHRYKVDVARTLLEMCAGLGCGLLVASSSNSSHASADLRDLARDLRKLAMLAVPFGIRIAYQAHPGARTVNDLTTAWDLVCRADAPNLGLGIDAFQVLAASTSPDAIEELDPDKVFLVQLSDFMWQEVRGRQERLATSRSFRVFPGEGVHTDDLVQLVLGLDALGYAGDYSLEVFNDDHAQLPPDVVVRRAARSALWLGEDVLRRSVPLPAQPRLHAAG